MTTPTPAQQLEEVLADYDSYPNDIRAHRCAGFLDDNAPTLRRALAALEAVEWRPMRECPIDTDVLLWNQETDEISIGMKPSDAPEDTAVIVDMTASWADWWRPLPPKPADAVEVKS